MPDPLINFDIEALPADMTNALAAGLVIEGAGMAMWWSRQSTTLHQQFMDQVRMSLENGESTAEAAARISGGTVDGVEVPGIMRTARRKAEGLVRTAINEVVTQARLNTFQDMGDIVKAIQQISTLDGRTSVICVAYSGLAWRIEDFRPIGHSLPFNTGPPRHFNCRSSIVPVLRSFEELGLDAKEVPLATRASMDGEVPGDITFDAWMRKKGKTFQDDLLGPTRAELWRKGEINLTQLVDMKGNPMTLGQLEKVVGRKLN